MRGVAALISIAVGGACGEDRGAREDAANGVDAGADAATYGPATVIIAPEGQPVAGRTIIFHDADGEVIGEVVTDANGAATHEVPRGALATWWDGSVLRTLAAVQPGDVIRVSSPVSDDGDVAGTVRVRVQGPVDGAEQYWATLGCDFRQITDTGAFTAVALRQRCLRENRFDVLAVAKDVQGGRERSLAFTYALDVAADADGVTNAPLPAWDTTPPSIAVTFTDAPDGLFSMSGYVSQYRNGIGYGSGVGSADLSADDPTLALPYPDGFADLLHVGVHVLWGDGISEAATVHQALVAPEPVTVYPLHGPRSSVVRRLMSA